LWVEAEKSGIRLVHVISNPEKEWSGEVGYISKEMLLKYDIDLEESMFYVSGPPTMVNAYRKMLKK